MRLCFVIACFAGIGVGVVHFRKAELVAKNQLVQLERRHEPLRRTSFQQESDLGHLTAPKEVEQRAARMNIDTESDPVHLAGPTDRTPRRSNRRATN
jgi:hypothetical protein